jgi:hypothetical protein
MIPAIYPKRSSAMSQHSETVESPRAGSQAIVCNVSLVNS